MGHTRLKAITLILALTMIVFVVSSQPVREPVKANPQFVLSSWNYPDEYGQGIDAITVYENSTGSWVAVDTQYYYENQAYDWNVSIGIKLRVYSWFNSSLMLLDFPDEGKAYLQHNVTVTQFNGTVVFSQQNFTYAGGESWPPDPLWRYHYDVVLNFLPIYGEVYTAKVNYEVFYPGGSGEYDVDDQSIDSFAETLPDDVLYYPDGLSVLAEGGNATAVSGGTYASTHLSDNVNWYVATLITGTEYTFTFQLNFNVTLMSEILIEYFFERSSGTGTFDEGGIQLYNFSSDTWGYIYEDEDWFGSETSRAIYEDSSDYIDTDGSLYLRVTLTLTDGGGGSEVALYIDFCSVNLMTLADSNHYAESFSDVSDWAYSGGGTSGTDGDVGYYDIPLGGYKYFYTNSPSAFPAGDYYAEARMKLNGSTGTCYGSVTAISGDSITGTGKTMIGNWYLSQSFETRKAFVTITLPTECFYISFKDASNNQRISIEYLRIYPAGESGWQHDGSTTSGISSPDGGTIATDGDKVTLTADGDGSTFLIVADTTTTASAISCTYYPFFALNITSGSGSWTLEQYDGSAYATLQSSTAISAGIKRFNMRALDTYVYWWRITLSASGVLVDDWAKAYGIANYTYTGSGTSTDDVLYVSSGTLYCQATSITSMVLDRDPALSVDTTTTTNSIWILTTSSGVPQSDYYVSAWSGYSSATSGNLASGTLTDVRIKFTANANIAAIEFLYPIDGWALVSNPSLIFAMPINTSGLDMLLIFLGLFMIPASTLYLVKGGKDEMSMNKFFFFIVIFMLGWALVIAGINS